MYLVPFFDKISDRVEKSLHDNILLLVDEIDLYCHPSWQQKLVKYLIDEIKILFSKKSVQIIFTTHSPIVLSDIPKNNIIYLQRKNGKCCVDDRNKHVETFGANIYKLFDDAFFLEEQGQIGEFSKNKIQNIIEQIRPQFKDELGFEYPKLESENIERLKQLILLIGEDVVRDQLLKMLLKCEFKNLGIRENKIKLYEERINYLRSEEDI